jgi:hypothetical protein
MILFWLFPGAVFLGPAAVAEGFHPRLEELLKAGLANRRNRSHTVQQGGRLSAGAEKPGPSLWHYLVPPNLNQIFFV